MGFLQKLESDQTLCLLRDKLGFRLPGAVPAMDDETNILHADAADGGVLNSKIRDYPFAMIGLSTCLQSVLKACDDVFGKKIVVIKLHCLVVFGLVMDCALRKTDVARMLEKDGLVV